MSDRKFSREKARRTDIVKARGAESYRASAEPAVPRLQAGAASFEQSRRLCSHARNLALEIRTKVHCARPDERDRYQALLKDMIRRLESSAGSAKSSECFELKQLFANTCAYYRWQSKRPEREDPAELYRKSVNMVQAAGDRFPSEVGCGEAIENLRSIVGWKRRFPSLAISAAEVREACRLIEQSSNAAYERWRRPRDSAQPKVDGAD